jgi:hypothetical protein
MPQKPQPRARSWGTRFDSLISSPPPSPDPTGTVVEQDSVVCDASNTSVNTPELLLKGREEKMPHDASVFVGRFALIPSPLHNLTFHHSLPSNMEQPELTRLLTEHLSEHAEVKNIKVVRDSKGGVCAFVQCEVCNRLFASTNSLTASLGHAPLTFIISRTRLRLPALYILFILTNPSLSWVVFCVMNRLGHSEPYWFPIGMSLTRFSYLITFDQVYSFACRWSQSTPMRFVPAGSADAQGTLDESNKNGKMVPLDLPSSMRLWRPRNAKYATSY